MNKFQYKRPSCLCISPFVSSNTQENNDILVCFFSSFLPLCLLFGKAKAIRWFCIYFAKHKGKRKTKRQKLFIVFQNDNGDKKPVKCTYYMYVFIVLSLPLCICYFLHSSDCTHIYIQQGFSGVSTWYLLHSCGKSKHLRVKCRPSMENRTQSLQRRCDKR